VEGGVELIRALDLALEAARRAGDLLRDDLHRPDGPRGHDDKADADVEAERLVRDLLLGAFPDWGYLGEETGRVAPGPGLPVWLVDPNDGTRDYLKGRRGSSVSIGLLYEGRPVLGVVFAFAYPDDRGDLFAWAEGCGPLRRNDRALEPRLALALGPDETVLISGGADRDPEMHLRGVAPARYRSVPSIAHRLALVAAGEAAGTVSLFAPSAWDFGAGHALLRASGAVLLDADAAPVGYRPDGTSRTPRAFAGTEGVARALHAAAWTPTQRGAGASADADGPVRLRRGRSIVDAGLLSRAQGLLLGQVAGDSLGALVEFQKEAQIAERFADGPRRLEDGGVHSTLAGQPTDDSEMALALARTIAAAGRYDPTAAIEAYRRWYRSGPFDVGTTTRTALSGYVVGDSQANGALMRVSPLAVFAHALEAERAAEAAREDAALTHPHAVCRDASAAFVVAASHAVRHGDGPEAAYAAALGWARAHARTEVVESLEAARDVAPVCDGQNQGWVRIALQNAFHELVRAASLEEGVVRTVRRGGDSDTNAAIAGALLGAVHGRAGVPDQWRLAILSCRPHVLRAKHPRPMAYWPPFVYELAELLLLAGNDAAAGA
jgi:ADP-ribosylglycohydrolase/fructose-1,6-bisphosphatase/inositol monophosphatase family enzyme